LFFKSLLAVPAIQERELAPEFRGEDGPVLVARLL
jgi:hypothetical protein